MNTPPRTTTRSAERPAAGLDAAEETMPGEPESGTAPGSEPRPVTPGEPRRALVLAALGTMLALVAFTSPIATLNAVSLDLGADISGRTWILSSMGIGLGAALLTAGTLADDRGRRRVLTGGLVLLAAASVAGALAPTTMVLVLARVAQGIGAAAVVAASLGLVAHWFRAGHERAAASGVWGASVGAGIALGPLLSSYLEQWATWRDAFWVVAVASVGLAAWGRLRLVEVRSATPRGLDVPGALLLAASMTTFLAALVEGRQGWASPTVVVLLAVAVAAGLGFLLVERTSGSAMIDLSLFRSPRFVAATAGAFATGAGIIGLLSFMPAFLGLAFRLPATEAALLFLTWSGSSVVMALLARRLPANVTGRARLAVGLVGVAVGQLLLFGLTSGTTWPRLLPGLVVAGVASGLLNAALGREAVASVPAERGGMGSGANNTARYVGSAVGVTVVSVVVAAHASMPPAAGLIAGWNVAAIATAAISLAGAGIVLAAREPKQGVVPAAG
ncbi:MFS transporter [Intrasporangium mesophilum]